ncbi:MAG TPA: hypothetical protein VKC34_17685 [Blastocatellia bacterium]|nr:hypothetical protein [Blastocatellia bacterium]
MKNSLMISIFLLSLAFWGCGKPANSNGDTSPQAPVSGGTPPGSLAPAQRTGPPDALSAKGPVNAPVLLSGVYTIAEVEEKGVVKMWPPDNKIEFTFSPDGTYARKAMIRGRVDHADTGQYRVEGGNRLILSIVSSDNKVQNPAKEIRHTIALSADGDSIKLTAKDGKAATFRKTGEAPGN